MNRFVATAALQARQLFLQFLLLFTEAFRAFLQIGIVSRVDSDLLVGARRVSACSFSIVVRSVPFDGVPRRRD